MNKILSRLIATGDIYKMRSLNFVIKGTSVAFVTEYSMDSSLGDFVWYTTWKDPACHDEIMPKYASIYIHEARARMYFPAFLDTRIPPVNCVNVEELMQKYGLQEYDKFDFVIATKGYSPVKAGLVHEVSPRHCPIEEIHAIDEIWEEYTRTL